MDASYLRPEVLAFAMEMEKKLRKHDKDRGDSYKVDSPFDLLRHCRKEVEELTTALHVYIHKGTKEQAIDVLEEAADVGNMAMMVAYVVCNNAGTHGRFPMRIVVNPNIPDNELHVLKPGGIVIAKVTNIGNNDE
jgi:hypothetical protein